MSTLRVARVSLAVSNSTATLYYLSYGYCDRRYPQVYARNTRRALDRQAASGEDAMMGAERKLMTRLGFDANIWRFGTSI